MTEPSQLHSDAPAADRDEFFIGWLPAPGTYVRFLRPIVVVLLLAAAGAAAALAFLQRDPGPGTWETDRVRTFEGVAYTRPYAMLRVAGEEPGDPPRTLLLVEYGKFGALPRVEQIVQGRAAGQAVRVSGTILHRDGRGMLELAEGEEGIRRLTAEEERGLPPLDGPAPRVLAETVALRGEIIDPKCYLGAMKPGGGKTHKACAMLCISGGVPPMLVTRDAGGQETFHLLTTAGGGAANEVVLPYVGDQIEATGKLEQHGDLLILQIAPGGVQRR
jgi:hypothetical protein